MRMITSRNISETGKKEDPGNYKPVSFTSVLGEITKTILGVAEKHLKDNAANCHI